MQIMPAEQLVDISRTKPAVFQFRMREEEDLTCWISRPERPDPEAVPLVAVHGLHRGARLQASLLGELAAKSGRTVVAPMFTTDRWPQYQQVVRKGRADQALLRLLEDLQAFGFIAPGLFDLFGYSAGGQFAHRFAMLYPHKIRTLSIAAPGWYTFPDDQEYPYGLSSNGRFGRWGAAMAAGLDTFLGLGIRVFVGANDCEPDDNTRRSAHLDAQQGTNRMARARAWVDALSRTAQDQGRTPRISLTVLPGCGHSFEQCVRLGALDRFVLDTRHEETITTMSQRELQS